MLANIGIDFVVFANASILRGHWLFSVDWQPYHGHLNFAAIKQLILALFNIGRFSFPIGCSLSNILEHGWVKIIAGYLI